MEETLALDTLTLLTAKAKKKLAGGAGTLGAGGPVVLEVDEVLVYLPAAR